MAIRINIKKEITDSKKILREGDFSFPGEKELLEKELPILEQELKEELEQVKKMNCDVCFSPFTKLDLKENNYQMITGYENRNKGNKESARHKTCEKIDYQYKSEK